MRGDQFHSSSPEVIKGKEIAAQKAAILRAEETIVGLAAQIEHRREIIRKLKTQDETPERIAG